VEKGETKLQCTGRRPVALQVGIGATPSFWSTSSDNLGGVGNNILAIPCVDAQGDRLSKFRSMLTVHCSFKKKSDFFIF
jgi:hypothetical protein